MSTNKEVDQYFIDSSFLIALMIEGDVHHKEAVQELKKILKQKAQIFLSDVVLNEVPTVLLRRFSEKSHQQKIQKVMNLFSQAIKNYPVLCLYQIYNQNYGAVLQLMKNSNGALSFHDGLILRFLKEVPQVRLLSFDAELKKFSSSSNASHQR